MDKTQFRTAHEEQRAWALAESDDDDSGDEGESQMLENSPTPVSHGEQSKNDNIDKVSEWLKDVIDVGIDEWFNGQGGYGRPWDIFTINLADTGDLDPNRKGELATILSWLDIWNFPWENAFVLDLDKLKKYATTIGLGELLMKKQTLKPAKAPAPPAKAAVSPPISPTPLSPTTPLSPPPLSPTPATSILPFMEFTQFDVGMKTGDTSKSMKSNTYNAYVNKVLVTTQKGESPNKNEWAIVPLLYADAVNDRSRWPELGIGTLGFRGINKDLNMFADVEAADPQIGSMDIKTGCLPISFRIRSDVFDDHSLSRFNEANKWMSERWLTRKGGENDARIDCSFTTLALLDIPISEIIRGQDFIMSEGIGLASSMMDFQYSSMDRDKTIMGNKSILPMNKISYIWHYSENYTSRWGKWLDDLYGSIPPYSGIILIVKHRGGGHFCVMSRGGYEKGSTVDYNTCYLFDAQRMGNNAYNQGKQEILSYLNGMGVYYMSVPCLRTSQNRLGDCEDDLVNLLPFEFDEETNLVPFSGFNVNGIPLRPVRRVSDIYGEITTMKMGMYTGKLKKKKKKSVKQRLMTKLRTIRRQLTKLKKRESKKKRKTVKKRNKKKTGKKKEKKKTKRR